MINLPALNFSICQSDLELQLLCWGWWWPISPSTGASLYNASLFNAWCHLSRVPLTQLSPYLPPSRSLENVEGKSLIPTSLLKLGFTAYLSPQLKQMPFFFQICFLLYTYSTAVITSCHLLFVFIKGRMDKIEVWANSWVAACHERKRESNRADIIPIPYVWNNSLEPHITCRRWACTQERGNWVSGKFRSCSHIWSIQPSLEQGRQIWACGKAINKSDIIND